MLSFVVVEGGLAVVVVLPVSSVYMTGEQLRRQEGSQSGRVESLILVRGKYL